MFLEPDFYLAPFVRYSLREIQNRYIWLPLLRLNLSTEGFLWDDFRKIFRGCLWMARVPNGVENIAENFNRLKDCLALGTDWDTASQPAVRWLFWTIVATEGKHKGIQAHVAMAATLKLSRSAVQ